MCVLCHSPNSLKFIDGSFEDVGGGYCCNTCYDEQKAPHWPEFDEIDEILM